MSLDDLQAQLRGTLDQQFAVLKQQYDDTLAEARRQAAADAERDTAARVEQVRAEFDAARTEWEALAAAARAEAEQQVAIAAAARADAEQRLAESAAARAEAEQAAQASQQAAQHAAQLAADVEQRAQAELNSLRDRMQAEIAAATPTAAANPAAPAPVLSGLAPAVLDRLLAATREIDDARTLSQALESLLQHAGAAAGRAVMFLIDGDRLKLWKAAGMPDVNAQTVESPIGERDLLGRAIQNGQAISSSAALPAPAFAQLPPDRAGLAVPVMVGGRAVAVLYADSGANLSPAGAPEVVEALVRHASAVVALRTAMRTLDVLGGAPDEAVAGGEVSDDQGARRYARLLVSEIKLYNEAAVRAGRQQRDLLQRLRPEIDRAQRMYEERVPPAVGGRHVYFQQELVQTLADGDAALLGNP